MNLPLVFAVTEQQSQTWGSTLSIFLMLGLFMVFFWFSGRKQRKREKLMAERRKNLKVGDRVMMSSGIYGKVSEVNADEDIVTITVGPGKVPLVFNKAYVSVVEYDDDAVDMSKEESKDSIKK